MQCYEGVVWFHARKLGASSSITIEAEPEVGYEIEDIKCPRGDTNFIFERWKHLEGIPHEKKKKQTKKKKFPHESEANEWEILSAREDEIRIPKRLCNVLLIL